MLYNIHKHTCSYHSIFTNIYALTMLYNIHQHIYPYHSIFTNIYTLTLLYIIHQLVCSYHMIWLPTHIFLSYCICQHLCFYRAISPYTYVGHGMHGISSLNVLTICHWKMVNLSESSTHANIGVWKIWLHWSWLYTVISPWYPTWLHRTISSYFTHFTQRYQIFHPWKKDIVQPENKPSSIPPKHFSRPKVSVNPGMEISVWRHIKRHQITRTHYG